MIVFQSRKVKKVKKLKKKKTIHTKYKHHRRTLKQPKHKSYNATQPYYNVNNKLGGLGYPRYSAPVYHTDLEHAAGILENITTALYLGPAINEVMIRHLDNLYDAYNNIHTYEERREFIRIFDRRFRENYNLNFNLTEYKYWFNEIITRIENRETDHVAELPDIGQKNLLLGQIAYSKYLIDETQ
jgi:hypothetical protein